jgi:hypothetical protein
VTKKVPESRVLTHAIVLDEKGNHVQTIDLPPGATQDTVDFFAVSKGGNTAIHIPFSTALSFDSASPAQPPIPSTKSEKEVFLGQFAIPLLRQIYSLKDPVDVSSNREDPPDLLASTSTRAIGIELCELIFPERYVNDSRLAQFEQAVRRRLPDTEFANYQLLFAFKYASDGRIRLPVRTKLDTAIVDLIGVLELVKGMACIQGATSMLFEKHLPESCISFLHLVALDNIGKPSNSESERPLIKFANYQQQFSKEAIRSIVSGPIKKKLNMKLSGDNVLLIWSQHPSLRFCIPETSEAIVDLLLERMRSPFRDVLYLHRSTERVIVVLMVNRRICVRLNNEERPA